MGLVLKALWLDLVDKKLGDCTTVVKDDAQEVTEKVVMTTFGLKRNKPARHAKIFVSFTRTN